MFELLIVIYLDGRYKIYSTKSFFLCYVYYYIIKKLLKKNKHLHWWIDFYIKYVAIANELKKSKIFFVNIITIFKFVSTRHMVWKLNYEKAGIFLLKNNGRKYIK